MQPRNHVSIPEGLVVLLFSKEPRPCLGAHKAICSVGGGCSFSSIRVAGV